MAPRLSIAQKGLILVSVPVAFELLFVFTLTYLLHQSETELRRQMHSKEVIEHANILMRHYLDASTAAGGYSFTRDPEFLMRYERGLAGAETEYAQLEGLVRDNPSKLQQLGRVKTAGDSLISLLTRFRRLIETMPDSMMMIGRRPGFQRAKQATELVGTEIDQFLADERSIEREGPVVQSRNRAKIETVLWGGVVMNIILAVSLALFFSRQIAARIRMMIENTLRFSQGKPLHPKLAGGDELAHLDSVFHTMADEINELDRLKKEFVAMVSHELRTPLTSVHGTLTLLESGAFGELSDRARQRIVTAEVDINRLIGLINDLLDVERLSSGDLEMHLMPVGIGEAFERAKISVEGFAEQQKVSIELVDSDLEVIADNDRIVQVLVNLLSNAIKFSPEGSSVRVSASDDGDAVVVRIEDKGRGIPAAKIATVFDRFKQMEADDSTKKGGSGLGLHISKQIIEQSRGTIGVESVEGAGSTFWFKLPKPVS